MPIVHKKKFYRTNLEQTKDTFTIKFDSEFTKEKLEEYKKLIFQAKGSTCLKQLASIGAKVVREEKTKLSLKIVMNNLRKNKRNNVIDFD